MEISGIHRQTMSLRVAPTLIDDFIRIWNDAPSIIASYEERRTTLVLQVQLYDEEDAEGKVILLKWITANKLHLRDNKQMYDRAKRFIHFTLDEITLLQETRNHVRHSAQS